MLKIFGVPLSVHTRKAIFVATLKNLTHEVVPVVPVVPDNLPSNWRQLSPTGKIPAITDGDFFLSDSAAICAYFERLQPTPSVYPLNSQSYARALSLEQYAGTLFRDIVHPLFAETFVHPKLRGIPTNQKHVDAVMANTVPEMFGYLNAAATNDYLVESALSIADIAVVSNLVTYQYLGFGLFRDDFPRLARLFDRVVSLPAAREVLRREQPVVDSMGLRRDFLAAAA